MEEYFEIFRTFDLLCDHRRRCRSDRTTLYNDVMSGLFVLGGALGFALLKDAPQQMAENFGAGAVYFGWLGALVGLIAIAGNAFGVWGNVAEMGPALVVSMLPILYGYMVKLICIAIASSPKTE